MNFSKPITVLFHAVFWLLLCTLPLIFVPMLNVDSEFKELGVSGIIYVTSLISIFYLNYHFLYPKYFVKKKIFTYVILCITTSLIFTSAYALVLRASNDLSVSPLLYVFVKSFVSLAVIAMSTFYRLMVDTLKQKREQQQKENENLKTELSFLRSQVSPHFMFNVLNSLVALIRQKSDQLEPAVMELSNLMRYMLYESDEELVNLKTEIEYVKSYINIQLLRFSNDVKVALDIQPDLPDRLIEPMLLIPLVENAFKHGIGMIDQPKVNIKISFTNNELCIIVKNKFNHNSQMSNKRNSGIGLENLNKRLTLLYPKIHTLSINSDQEWFQVSLHIKMKGETELEQISSINNEIILK